MPEATIYNPAGAYGQVAPAPNQSIEMVNNSGGPLLPGDLVVIATDVTGVLVTTTTTVNDKSALGVVAPRTPTDALNTQAATNTYAAGATVPVVVRGPARIQIGASNVVAAGDLLTTSAVAKTAQTNAGAPGANANTFSIIAYALEASTAKDSNNTIRAYINK